MRYPFEEFTTVVLVTDPDTVASVSAPTLAEIAAGDDITCFLTKDGLNPGGSTNTVDSGSLCNRVDGKGIGSVSYDFSLKGYKDNDIGGDTFWDLCTWGLAAFLIVRYGYQYGTAFAAGQPVLVYEGTLGEPIVSPSAANSQVTFTEMLAIQTADIKAVVAA